MASVGQIISYHDRAFLEVEVNQEKVGSWARPKLISPMFFTHKFGE